MRKPDKLEKREAMRDGASLVPNSGRGKLKGDAVDGEYLVDYKHNERSFTLNVDAWLKHSRDAWNEIQGEPLIKVIFGDGTRVVMISEDQFNYLRESTE